MTTPLDPVYSPQFFTRYKAALISILQYIAKNNEVNAIEFQTLLTNIKQSKNDSLFYYARKLQAFAHKFKTNNRPDALSEFWKEQMIGVFDLAREQPQKIQDNPTIQKTMKKIDVFTLTGNSDQTEGRGSTITLAHFADAKEGLKVLNDPRFYRAHGVQGMKMDEKYSTVRQTIKIYETADEYWAEKQVDIRQKALAKLSCEEIAALGIKP